MVFKCIFCKVQWHTDECGHPYYELSDQTYCTECADKIIRDALNENKYGNSVWIAWHYLRQNQSHRKKRKSLKSNKKLFKELMIKYKFKCNRCSENDEKKLTVDHIKPVSKGGVDDFINLQILCKSCNSKKGAKYE